MKTNLLLNLNGELYKGFPMKTSLIIVNNMFVNNLNKFYYFTNYSA